MNESDAPGTEAIGTEELWMAPDGSLWAVTDGLSRFDGSRWETYLEGSRVTDVAFAPDGSVWAATMWAGAYYFDGGEWAHFGVDDGLVSEQLTSVAVGIDGSVWFGTATDGVMRFAPDG
jgi:ligand-binding sensor domain-containing protein